MFLLSKGQQDTLYCREGIIYRDKSNCKKAIKYFSKAIRQNPAYERAYYNRGSCYLERGKIEKAFQDFDRSVALSKNQVDLSSAMNARGMLYYKKKEYRLALSDFTNAIKIDSLNEHAYHNRGSFYDADNKTGEAINDYLKAISIGERNGKVQDYFYLDLAIIYFDEHAYEKALSVLSKAIQLNDKYVEAYRYRAMTYEKLGKEREAEEDYEKIGWKRQKEKMYKTN